MVQKQNEHKIQAPPFSLGDLGEVTRPPPAPPGKTVRGGELGEFIPGPRTRDSSLALFDIPQPQADHRARRDAQTHLSSTVPPITVPTTDTGSRKRFIPGWRTGCQCICTPRPLRGQMRCPRPHVRSCSEEVEPHSQQNPALGRGQMWGRGFRKQTYDALNAGKRSFWRLDAAEVDRRGIYLIKLSSHSTNPEAS